MMQCKTSFATCRAAGNFIGSGRLNEEVAYVTRRLFATPLCSFCVQKCLLARLPEFINLLSLYLKHYMSDTNCSPEREDYQPHKKPKDSFVTTAAAADGGQSG